MADPITWRSISGFNPADAYRPMEGARDAFNSSFGILNKLLEQRESLDEKNYQNQMDNAQSGYMNLLQSLTSPEAFVTAQQSGQLQQAFGALAPSIQNRVRGEDEKRLAYLQDSLIKRQQFDEGQLEHERKPARQAYLSSIFNQDKGRQAELLQQNPWLADMADISEKQIKFNRETQEFEWKGNQERRAGAQAGRAAEAHAADMRYKGQQFTLGQLQLDEAQAAAQEAARVRDEQRQAREIRDAFGNMIGQRNQLLNNVPINERPSDTDFMAKTADELVDVGGYPRHLVEQAKQELADQLKPTLVGNDADALNIKIARAQFAVDEMKRTKDEAMYLDAPHSDVDGILKSIKDSAPNERVAGIIGQAMSKAVNEGVVLKGKRYYPGPAALRLAAASTYQTPFIGWTGVRGANTYESTFKDALENIMSNPDMADEMVKTADVKRAEESLKVLQAQMKDKK